MTKWEIVEIAENTYLENSRRALTSTVLCTFHIFAHITLSIKYARVPHILREYIYLFFVEQFILRDSQIEIQLLVWSNLKITRP